MDQTRQSHCPQLLETDFGKISFLVSGIQCDGKHLFRQPAVQQLKLTGIGDMLQIIIDDRHLGLGLFQHVPGGAAKQGVPQVLSFEAPETEGKIAPVELSFSVETGKDLRASGNHPEETYHFRGHSAVIYMRIRKAGGGGDFMRTQRVRTVLSSLADKCREITWEDAQALVNNVMDNNNTTNMNLEEMMDAYYLLLYAVDEVANAR